MKKKSRFVAVCAMLSAASAAVLYVASVIPTGQLGFVAAASLFGIAAVIEMKLRGGIAVFAVTALLGFIILPVKSAWLLYILFFGWYPTLKSIAENRKSRLTEWIIKITAANAALAIIMLLFSGIVFDFLGLSWSMPVIFIVFNICFILFDVGVSKVIGLYLARVSKHIK